MPNMERYSRNIALTEIGEEGQLKLLNSKVLIAGAGGAGSTVIMNLAALGIGNIGIIDNDIVELSNLNRQLIYKCSSIGKPKVDEAKRWVNEFNPDVNVKTYQLRLSEDNYKEIVAEYDLIVDCFDTLKSMFLLNKIALGTNKTLVSSGCGGFEGIVYTIIAHDTACLRCVLPDHDEDYIENEKGIISPNISTIASLMSYEVAKIILGIGTTLTQRAMQFNGLDMRFSHWKFKKNPKCPLCGNN